MYDVMVSIFMTPKFESAVFPLTKQRNADQAQVLILAENTGRLLLANQSPLVGTGTWGMWDSVRDDAGYQGKMKLIKKSQMKYDIGRYNFISIIGVVPSEFIPTLGEKVENYQWVLGSQLSDLKMHESLRIYSKAVGSSLENYYKEFINEYSQSGDLYTTGD